MIDPRDSIKAIDAQMTEEEFEQFAAWLAQDSEEDQPASDADILSAA